MVLDDDKTIDKLISNKFEIDCIDITLIQAVRDNPLVYSGSGTIYQGKDGNLSFKLYSKTIEIEKEFDLALTNSPPGKFLEEKHYFTFDAIDMSGGKWVSDKVRIPYSFTSLDVGRVIKTKLKNIKFINELDDNIPESSNYTSLFFIISGIFKLPFNSIEELPNGERRLNKLTFSVNQIDFELHQHKSHLSIFAKSKKVHLDYQFGLLIIEALSIYFGRYVRPIAIEYLSYEEKWITLFSLKHYEFELPSPISRFQNSRFDTESFSCFISNYLISIDRPYSELFRFWNKVFRSWEMDFEYLSLPLSVAIEGVTNKYFKEYGSPDKELLTQASDAKTIIYELNIGDKVKRRLLKSIETVNIPSAANALYTLANEGVLNHSHVDVWKKIRNKTAHAGKVDIDPSRQQENIDQVFICLMTFYRIIFHIIHYKGNCIDYSEDGWPQHSISDVS